MSRSKKEKRSSESALPLSKGETTRLKILGAATKVIAADGLHGMTYEKVAVAAGSTRQLVQTYFPNRETLFLACQALGWERYRNYVVEEVERRSAQKTELDAYIEASFTWMAQHPEEASLLALFQHLCFSNATFRQHNTDLIDKGTQRITGFIKELRPDLSKVEATERARAIQLLIAGSLYAVAAEDRDHVSMLRLLRRSVQRILSTIVLVAAAGFMLFQATPGQAMDDCERVHQGKGPRIANVMLSHAGVMAKQGVGVTMTGEAFHPIMALPSYHLVWAKRTFVGEGLRTEVSNVESRAGIDQTLLAAYGHHVAWPKAEDGKPLGTDTSVWGLHQSMPLMEAFAAHPFFAAEVSHYYLQQQRNTIRLMLSGLSTVHEHIDRHYQRRDFGAQMNAKIIQTSEKRLFNLTVIRVFEEGSSELIGTIGFYRAPYGTRDLYKIVSGERVLISSDAGKWGPSYWLNHTGDPFFATLREGVQFEHVKDLGTRFGPDEVLVKVPTEEVYGPVDRIPALIYLTELYETSEGSFEIDWGIGEVIEPTMYAVDKSKNRMVRARILMHLLDFAYDPRFPKEYNDNRIFVTYNDLPALYAPTGFKRNGAVTTINNKPFYMLQATGASIYGASKDLAKSFTERDGANIEQMLNAFDSLSDGQP